MANVVDLTRSTIEHQAKEWLIRMDGDEPLTDGEKAALSEWMNRSAFHAGELTRIARLWRRANVMTELFSGLESLERKQKKSRGKKRAFIARCIWTTLMAATAVVCSVILVCCGMQQSAEVVTGTYETFTRLHTNHQVEVTYRSDVD